MNIKTISIIASIIALTACGKPDVSFDTLETSRGTAKGNAEYNGQKFRSEHPQFAGFSLEMQGDSTQSPDCPQGDGWASGKLIKAETGQTTKLKCSTVSGAIGCMTQADFDAKPYASDDGHCQPTSKVPFPLPKIAK
jgi:hypothetical protein